MYLFNARSEGKLNPKNEMHYKGVMGIFKMPSFRTAIQELEMLRYDKKKGEGMAKPGVNRMAAVKQVV